MYDSEALREKGVAIVQRLRDAVDQWKEETGYGLACTARRAKTCATASAVWTPPSSALWKA
jgi:anaerobic ribonucleoside-triphosphate reductase